MKENNTSSFCTPLVLLTDFGHQDGFVGVMKGVIASIAPLTPVIDLSHEVEPQNVFQASLILKGSFSYFPEGSLFVCVVDPGVGTERRIILLEYQKRLFLAPDNGLLTFLLYDENEDKKASLHIYEVTNEEFFLSETPSDSFHGRDIFAPVAAYLSGKDVSPPSLGRQVGYSSLHTSFLLPPPRISSCRITGEVICCDHFGNCITNISAKDLAPFGDKRWLLSLYGNTVGELLSSYAGAQEGKPACLINSWGFVEVFLKNDHARQKIPLKEGEVVILFFEE